MVGDGLLRYNPDRRFLIWDSESEGLNLGFHRPWELSYSVATLRDGILWSKQHYIWYDDLKVSPDAARVTRFRYEDYKRVAIPAQEAWDHFSPLLYSPEHYAVGHNLLGFDVNMVSTLRRALGLSKDHSWTLRTYDTNALAKGFQKGWVPDTSSPEALLGYQYRCMHYREKGLKSNLGYMAKALGIPYDEHQAHGAAYDTQINWEVFKGLVWKMEI